MSDATQAETAEGVDAEERDDFGEFQAPIGIGCPPCADFTFDIEMNARCRRETPLNWRCW